MGGLYLWERKTYVGLFLQAQGLEGIRANALGKIAPEHAALAHAGERVETQVQLGLWRVCVVWVSVDGILIFFQREAA